MKKLYLVDVSSIFFRAYYAIRHLRNNKGFPTNALYGFLAAMTKIIRENVPDGIAFCYDSPEPTFREEIYKDYKANRDEAPEDLVQQIPYLKKLAEALNIPGFEKAGLEADDLIGCLVLQAKKHGWEVLIVSSDKDFGQLVQPGVTLFDPSKEGDSAFMDRAGVKAKWGIEPEQVIDYLAIVGDASDNVPGVRGIGPKGAQKLLAEFGTLENIYDNLDKIKNERSRELLKTSRETAFLSKTLVTIKCDTDLNVKMEDLISKPVNRDLLVPLLQELEFKSLLQKLLGESSNTDNSSKVGPSQNKVLPSEVKAGFEVSKPRPVDTELVVTGNVSDINSEFEKRQPSGLWLDFNPRGLVVQISKTVFRFEGEFEKLAAWLREKIARFPLKLSGYDVKDLAHQIAIPVNQDFEIEHDVLLEAYATGMGGDYSLPQLAKTYLNHDLPEFALPEERLHIVKELSFILSQKIDRECSEKILKGIELKLVPVLYRMERHGVLINSSELDAFSIELLNQTQGLEKEIFKLVGSEFNVGSPKQLGQILFEKLKLMPLRKTKTGYSTDSDVLEKLKAHHPVAEKILNWRELSKLRSTYVDSLPRLVNPATGRVHTTFNQAVAATGRLSSTNPNLQNIPIRTPLGHRLRRSFIAPKGSQLLTADYSQIELRILAHVTDEPALVQAFERDIDIHAATASEVFGVTLENVTADQRRAAKAINFGIAYGMSDFGLAESLGVELKVAHEYISLYFTRYPNVREYMHETVEQGKRDGFVKTLFGRQRYYPDLKAPNQMRRQAAERQVINMPMQGAAADLIKLAMIEVDRGVRGNDGKASMLLQVHDELVFEVEKEESRELTKKVVGWMENTTKLKVPLKVSIGVGDNWGDAE